VSSQRLVRNDHLVFFAVISTLVIASPSISRYGYFDVTKEVYGQSDSDQTNSNSTNLVNLQDIPLEKVHVGDISIAYKMFGKGDPILLHNGASDNMDAWDPALLSRLSSNNTVIVFDSRGIGNTTSGTEPYSIELLANDAAGLMDALKIKQANVLGYSLGTFIVQQFAITYPDMVSSIILIAGSCGGEDGIPKSSNLMKLQSEVANKTLNNISITREEMKSFINASLGSGWVKLHPESVDIPENISLEQVKPGLSPETANNQKNVDFAWQASNWSGVCDELAKIDKPTLVIAGTDDIDYMPYENALIIANKVPGAWLVQIKDAGHAVVNQYPAEVGEIVNTFLSTTGQRS
jgi:pimeloyl-ACP methyl ester carboxylesterase